MVCSPPPIQEPAVPESRLFPQRWIKWFIDICDRITALEKSLLTDFFAEVALGNIEGVSALSIIGRTPTITAGQGSHTVWDGASSTNKLYTYLSADTTLHLTSSDASDTMLVVIAGMDDNYNIVNQIKFLTGQTSMALDTDIFRVFELRTPFGAPLGDVYLTSSTDVTGGVPDTESEIKAKIINGNLKTNMGLFTVPAGKSFAALIFRDLLEKGKSLTIETLSRPSTSTVFTVESRFPGYQNNLITEIPGRFVTPEKTDVEFRVSVIDTDSPAFMSAEFNSYDNSLTQGSMTITSQWEALE